MVVTICSQLNIFQEKGNFLESSTCQIDSVSEVGEWPEKTDLERELRREEL